MPDTTPADRFLKLGGVPREFGAAGLWCRHATVGSFDKMILKPAKPDEPGREDSPQVPPQIEVVLAPGKAARQAVQLRHFRLFAQLSRDDLIRLCDLAARGAAPDRWGLQIQWRNGSQTDVEVLGHLNELQEPSEVDTVTGFWEYPDGSRMGLGASDGIVMIKADPQPDAIARKRFHELKHDLTTLRAPKRRTPILDLPSAALWLPGAAFGMIVGGLLGRVNYSANLTVGIVASIVGLGIAMYGFYSRKRLGPKWLVIDYRERKKVNWALWLSLLGTLAAVATVVVMLLQWIAPRGTP